MKPSLSAVPKGGSASYQETLTERFAGIIKKAPPGKRAPQEVHVEVKYRAPHEMYGHEGYSAVSNEFLSDVLAVLIAQHGMSPIQSAVLVFCIGRQREGWLKATHAKIAKHLGVERSNVTRAVGRLEGWHMLQQVENGVLFVNPLIAFKGNGDRQQEVLATLRGGNPPEGSSPTLNAPPPPRSIQLELGETEDEEEQAC
ncbi:MarR family transcriptional regulator [Actinacidiphila soli]|uniref:MarR family transcriptional regulator n=1 Tax=Actinacidiphila soli TaxID=2487275 RepID=UPI0013E306E2|nr:helix-turn-helix domain-containing protein [Actinacidiphila soli]